jgi:hypothetical protein
MPDEVREFVKNSPMKSVSPFKVHEDVNPKPATRAPLVGFREAMQGASTAASPPALHASPVSKISFGAALDALTSKAEGSPAEQADSVVASEPVDPVAWQKQIEADMHLVESALFKPASNAAEPSTNDQAVDDSPAEPVTLSALFQGASPAEVKDPAAETQASLSERLRRRSSFGAADVSLGGLMPLSALLDSSSPEPEAPEPETTRLIEPKLRTAPPVKSTAPPSATANNLQPQSKPVQNVASLPKDKASLSARLRRRSGVDLPVFQKGSNLAQLFAPVNMEEEEIEEEEKVADLVKSIQVFPYFQKVTETGHVHIGFYPPIVKVNEQLNELFKMQASESMGVLEEALVSMMMKQYFSVEFYYRE